MVITYRVWIHLHRYILYTFVPSSLVYVNIPVNCESYVQKVDKIIGKYQGREVGTSNFVTAIVIVSDMVWS